MLRQKYKYIDIKYEQTVFFFHSLKTCTTSTKLEHEEWETNYNTLFDMLFMLYTMAWLMSMLYNSFHPLLFRT